MLDAGVDEPLIAGGLDVTAEGPRHAALTGQVTRRQAGNGSRQLGVGLEEDDTGERGTPAARERFDDVQGELIEGDRVGAVEGLELLLRERRPGAGLRKCDPFLGVDEPVAHRTDEEHTEERDDDCRHEERRRDNPELEGTAPPASNLLPAALHPHRRHGPAALTVGRPCSPRRAR